MHNVIFIAPPAAGKGTQSEKIVNKYNYEHISTGDLLREEIKNETSIGKEIESIIAQGKFVNDDIITTILKTKLYSINKNFILDGYPRNINQAKELDKILNELNIKNVVVIYLELAEDVAIKRALGRLICPSCSTSYHKYVKELVPDKEGYCNNCNSKLIQRADDTEETFKVRFQTYLKETEPLLAYYKEKNMLEIVNADTDTLKIFADIEEILTGERSNG